jgi:hypothetical protein
LSSDIRPEMGYRFSLTIGRADTLMSR